MERAKKAQAQNSCTIVLCCGQYVQLGCFCNIYIYIASLPMYITLGQIRSQNKDICLFIHIATKIQPFVIAVINIQTGMSIN